MDDTSNITAENERAPLESVETSPVSEAPEQEAHGTEQEQEGQPEKPTRGEKRFRDLSEKNRKLAEELEALKSQVTEQPYEDVPLYDPNESEIDVNELQARIDKRIEQKVSQRLEQNKALEKEVTQVQRLYNEFADDLEGVLGSHPEFDEGGALEKQFVDLFNKLNTEDRRGQRVYVPKVKASEVVELLDNVRSTMVDTETARITGATIRQSMEGALSPAADKTNRGDYVAEDLRSKAIESGNVETWAQYLKQIGLAKVTQ